MNSFSEVGLGFAEFVAQLLNETFDSVLTSQNYQLEKYIELENAKNLSNERFFALYLDDSVLSERELDIFGLALQAKMHLSPTILAILDDIFGTEIKGIVEKDHLTEQGYQEVKAFLLETVVEERKAMIDTLLGKMELARLVVDSGEIKAKLELSNLYEEDSSTTAAGAGRKKATPKRSIKRPTTDPTKLTQATPDNLTNIIRNIDIKQYVDPTTQLKTLIVDKASIADGTPVKALIPDVRVIAKPVKMTSSSNLYSEVVIKFKTV